MVSPATSPRPTYTTVVVDQNNRRRILQYTQTIRNTPKIKELINGQQSQRRKRAPRSRPSPSLSTTPHQYHDISTTVDQSQNARIATRTPPPPHTPNTERECFFDLSSRRFYKTPHTTGSTAKMRGSQQPFWTIQQQNFPLEHL